MSPQLNGPKVVSLGCLTLSPLELRLEFLAFLSAAGGQTASPWRRSGRILGTLGNFRKPGGEVVALRNRRSITIPNSAPWASGA
jgi:hypothetical protein